MQPDDTVRLEAYYKESLALFGEADARSVHWSDHQGQQTRFLILNQIANLDGKSVLDVGCGLGDLCTFFELHRTHPKYKGIDIMPKFIAAAKKRFPNESFEVKNITDVSESYDYVLASGALSFKIENYKEYYFAVIKKMYSVAGKGVAFNMLNCAWHIDDDTYAAYDPDEVVDYCKTFCENVQCTLGYLPQDFTVYLYK